MMSATRVLSHSFICFTCLARSAICCSCLYDSPQIYCSNSNVSLHISHSRFQLPSTNYNHLQVLLTLHVTLDTVAAHFYGVIDCVNRLRHSSHCCCLNAQFRPDIKWWQQFLVTFNGRRMMLDFRHPVVIQTNASFLSYGAICSDDWFAGAWARSTLIDYNMLLYVTFHGKTCTKA